MSAFSIVAGKSLDHMLMKFEQNRVVQTTQNFELFGQKQNKTKQNKKNKQKKQTNKQTNKKKKKKKKRLTIFGQSVNPLLEDVSV